jgi:hypothetical protein
MMFHGNPASITGQYAARILTVAPAAGLFGIIALLANFVIRREPSPTKAALRLAKRIFANPAQAVAALIAVGLVPILMGAFGTLKMLMPLSRPFSWDDRLAAADRILFLGTDPWRITHALFGGPTATRIIDVGYTLWVPAVMVGVLLAAVQPPVARARYFLSFAAVWPLVGVVGAYALTSAGPCYAALIGTETAPWFSPLMQRLAENSQAVGGIGALGWQQVLWNAYENHIYDFAHGISAAPSMHNAICTLYVLALADARPAFRLLAKAYAALVFVGSIHLGWHYAIDGILGIAAMLVIWKGVCWYLDRVGYTSASIAKQVIKEGEAEVRPFPA